jgi:hypothetical protein
MFVMLYGIKQYGSIDFIATHALGEAYIHKINQSKTINLTLTMNVTVRVRFMVWDWFIL